jgi:hypothetical protein
MSSLPKVAGLHPAPPQVEDCHIVCGGCGALVHLGHAGADTLIGQCISCHEAACSFCNGRPPKRPGRLKAFVQRYPDLCAIVASVVAAALWLAAVVAFL